MEQMFKGINIKELSKYLGLKFGLQFLHNCICEFYHELSDDSHRIRLQFLHVCIKVWLLDVEK